jgi:hypothetical protein
MPNQKKMLPTRPQRTNSHGGLDYPPKPYQLKISGLLIKHQNKISNGYPPSQAMVPYAVRGVWVAAVLVVTHVISLFIKNITHFIPMFLIFLFDY